MKKQIKKITTQMVTAIKQSPKGKLPTGLQNYLAAKKAGKATAKPQKKGYNFAAAEKKLGVVNH